MRNLLAFLAAVVLAFLGFGWYLGWYTFHTVPAEAGHRGVTIDVNDQKIKKDVQLGVRAGEEKIHDFMDKGKATEAATAADKKTPGPGSDGFNGLRNFPRLLVDYEEQAEPAKTPSK